MNYILKNIVFIFFSLVIISNGNYAIAQGNTTVDTKFLFPKKNYSISEIISEIESASQYKFSYSSSAINVKRKIELIKEKYTLIEVLEILKSDYQLNNQFKKNKILLFPLKNVTKYTINGYIKDLSTGENLINANIYTVETYFGTISNTYGFFSLTLPKGRHKLHISYVGYKLQEETILLYTDTILNFNLKPVIELNEIIVKSDNDPTLRLATLQQTKVQPKELEKLPVLMGEGDILKSIQLLPGIQSGSEGTSGLYVRGGGPDQNLVLLDGVPVYATSHLFGYFSVFNNDAIKSMKVISGGFPARYGGRLSSVVDIRMKDGNNQKLAGQGSVGLLATKLTLEGPIKNENTTFMISARRTYIDLFIKPLINKLDDIGGEAKKFYFWDLNAKINHKFSHKSRLYYSLYSGRDVIQGIWEEGERNEVEDIKWGNMTNVLRWNYIITDKLFSNITATTSHYSFSVSEDYHHRNFNYFNSLESKITDYSGKIDFDYIPTSNHFVRFGGSFIQHKFQPGKRTLLVDVEDDSIDIDTILNNQHIYTNEIDAFIEDEIKISTWLNSTIGIHYSNYGVQNKNYQSWQPRFSISTAPTSNLSFFASYTFMTQHIHLLSNNSNGMPLDIWLPVTNSIKPQKAIQYTFGSSYDLRSDLSLKVELFYKNMDNVIGLKEGTSFLNDEENWQDNIELGKGKSYGLEYLLSKTEGKTTGWIGYTLSKSTRKFPNINAGKEFPYKYDRRHDISLVIMHKIKDNIEAGFIWVYSTGNAITLAYNKYYTLFTNNTFQEIEQIEQINDYRMPSYHRLDLTISVSKEVKWGERKWSFGLYNAYSRRNPYFMQFAFDENNNRKLRMLSLLPILPTINYSFKF
jgi:CarboxypepD_reg-like domain/TonB-dependent Receptor Plug Domain